MNLVIDIIGKSAITLAAGYVTFLYLRNLNLATTTVEKHGGFAEQVICTLTIAVVGVAVAMGVFLALAYMWAPGLWT